MHLQLKHFGRIREADLDIRPLTVFVGENGTNKSWAAYALHGLLRTASRDVSSYQTLDKLSQSKLRRSIENLLSSSDPGSHRSAVFTTVLLSEGPTGIGFSRSAISRFLAVEQESLSEGASAALAFSHSELTQALTSLNIEHHPELDTLEVHGHTASGDERHFRAIGLEDHSAIAARVEQFATASVERVVLLPAERKAFTGLAGFDRALDALRTGKQGAIPLAWVDFADMLREAMGASAQVSPLADVAKHFATLTGGLLQADRNTLNFRVEDGPTLPMHGAASLVRAVAGLDLYLSRLARKGDVVIIDELEMNAHPSAQLALVELVAMIVQAGVRVVFTTHSPYIVDHLNNLMAASSVPAAAQQGLAEQFALKSTQAFIAPEMVAAYRFQGQSDGSVAVHDVLNRERARISWTTFTEVSDRLSALWDSVDEAKSKPAAEAKAGAKPGKSKPARAA